MSIFHLSDQVGQVSVSMSSHLNQHIAHAALNLFEPIKTSLSMKSSWVQQKKILAIIKYNTYRYVICMY